MAATGLFSDGTSRDVTGSATWRSANPNSVAVSPGGLATCVNGNPTPVPVSVSASVGSVTGATGVTCTNPSIL
jgi:hypothetical protein